MNKPDCDSPCRQLDKKQNGWTKSILWVGLMILALCTVAFATHGRFGIEKILTRLAMPLGIGWLLLTCVTIHGWISQSNWVNRCLATLCWLVMTACSTDPLPDLLMRQLESQVVHEFQPGVDEALDAVIVFGGGTSMGKYRPEAGDAGDRVLYAAQLYLQGHTKQLISTGDGCGEDTKEIWSQLSIPDSAITTLPGANTFQEIENLKPLLEQASQARYGILSSAYHLPRVQRLATSAGFPNLITIAANHRSGGTKYSIINFVPDAHPLARFSDGFKEVLGRAIGR
jgi:uncharacterized SAM-binding protein YcdF (DUF218 family)